MRIIFLNIWHGKVWNGLSKFISDQSSKTDIFCFMEVEQLLQSRLESLLAGFTPIYDPGIKTHFMGGTEEGRSVFVKNNIQIEKKGKISLYHKRDFDAGGFLWAKLKTGDKPFFVGNVHGKARPGSKLDTPIRLRQSQKLVDFFKDKKEPVIFGGDFNLYPETKSVKMIEDAGYRNLIKDFKIDSTRNRLSWEQFNNIQHWADYAFVSKDVDVMGFEVPKVEISDHLPLIVDFEI